MPLHEMRLLSQFGRMSLRRVNCKIIGLLAEDMANQFFAENDLDKADALLRPASRGRWMVIL